MKKMIACILALLLLAGCAAPASQSVELVVFAAASMTETLTVLGEQYMQAHPDVSIVFNFDSSGTLKTQILEGAQCDIFLSAGQKQMDQLDVVLEETRFDILENKVVLAVPQVNHLAINSFDNIMSAIKNGAAILAIGNSDVPVGQYTQKILAYYGLSEEALAAAGTITYGSNVKEIVTQIREAAVDAGIIYQTDAYSAGLSVVDTATAAMCGQVIYPAAVLSISEHPAAAQDFLDYLASDAGDAVFEAVGFTPIS